MISEMSAGLASLKALGDVMKLAAEARDEAVLKAHLSDLQTKFIEVQQFVIGAGEREQTLKETIADLKAGIAARDNWDEISKNYEIRLFSNNPIVVTRSGVDVVGDPHWHCVSCFNSRRVSALLCRGEDPKHAGQRLYHCPTCKAQLVVQFLDSPDQFYSYRDGKPEGEPPPG